MSTPTRLILPGIPLGWQTGLNIRENLQAIEFGELRRTVNGTLLNLIPIEFRKYSLTISSDDMRPPALSRLWKGTELNGVVPVSELGDFILMGGTSRTLERTPYAGSVRLLGPDGLPAAVPFTINGKIVTLTGAAPFDLRIYYRPVLRMLVSAAWTNAETERSAVSSWTLPLEEV